MAQIVGCAFSQLSHASSSSSSFFMANRRTFPFHAKAITRTKRVVGWWECIHDIFIIMVFISTPSPFASMYQFNLSDLCLYVDITHRGTSLWIEDDRNKSESGERELRKASSIVSLPKIGHFYFKTPETRSDFNSSSCGCGSLHCIVIFGSQN